MKKDARQLKDKALASLRRSVQAFNSYDDDGRVTAVLLHLQHSFEMLLKAGLVERGMAVFDKRSGRSIGFDRSLNLAVEQFKIDQPTAGALRTIDALRDDEQHFLGGVEERLLYLHMRAGVTAFDELLQTVFGEHLSDHFPDRVLPVSSTPPEDFDILVDSEFSQIQELLKPKQRKRSEARQKIRTLLALEAHVSDEVGVSEKDVTRVERAIKSGKSRASVFPRLGELGTEISGTGVGVTVHFTKHDGAPVHFVSADDPGDTAAVRELDLQRRFQHRPARLADLLGLNTTQCKALREHLGIDDDPACSHVFEFGASKHPAYSDTAVQRMREAIAAGVDVDDLVRQRRAASRAAGSAP